VAEALDAFGKLTASSFRDIERGALVHCFLPPEASAAPLAAFGCALVAAMSVEGPAGGFGSFHSAVLRSGTKRLEVRRLPPAAGDDRTLFFDFLPVSALAVRGFTAKFQVYTVPGQVYYNMTRKLVLRGCDGLVFVADSQWDRLRENVESFRNLEENLREYSYNIDEIPYVIQYNKRDLANVAPLEYMEFLLNRRARRVPSFEAVAVNGDGVFDTLNTVSRMVLVGEFGQEKGADREQTA